MFEGQLLFPAGPNPAVPYRLYGPWMLRRGDSVRCTVDVGAISGAPVVDIELFTKNTEDAGDGTNADAAAATVIVANAIGRQTVEWLSAGNIALKELVRYRYTITGNAVTDWIIFRMLQPVWFDSLKA